MKFLLCFFLLCVFDKFITVKCFETENSSSRERAEVSDEVSDEVTDTVTAEFTEEDERDPNEIKRVRSNENDSEVDVDDVTGSIEETKNSNQDLSDYDNNSKVHRVNDNHASIEQYDTSKDRSSSDSNEKLKPVNNNYSDESSQSQSDEMNPNKNPVWLGEANPQYLYEQLNGHKADGFGTNQHYSYPSIYKDMGRRFVLQYPYEEVSKKKESKITHDKLITIKEAKLTEDKLIPIKAPPDLVLAVAKESALLESAKPKNPTDELMKKEALRTGEYWDGIWKEDMDSKLLRSKQKVLKSKKNTFNTRPIKKTGIKPKLVSKKKESKITHDKLITIKEAKLTEDKLIPIKAPPDLVLAVAKESALLESAKPKNPTDELMKKEALRTGEYWDGIWKEDMDSKLLRSKQKVLKSKKNTFNTRPIKKTGIKPKLGSIKAKVMPGSNLYGLISVLKEYSPRLLYIVNKNKI